MSSAARKRPGSFGRILRAELSEQDISIRELARRLAPEPTEKSVENTRRLLHQYLAGEVTPRLGMREKIADVLDLDLNDFYDEESRAQADLEQLMEALAPLADVLLELANRARDAA